MSISKIPSKHPIAILLSPHIRNFEEMYDVPFYQTYFVKLQFNRSMYKNGMIRALLKIDELKFFRQFGLDDGMNLANRREVWKIIVEKRGLRKMINDCDME